MQLIEISKKYFFHFNQKDINSLQKLFATNIRLCDWEIDVSGFEQVVNQNIQIFNDLKKFKLIVSNIYQSGNTVFAEINIILDSKEIIKVLDKIVFDKDSKIIEIIAYKG